MLASAGRPMWRLQAEKTAIKHANHSIFSTRTLRIKWKYTSGVCAWSNRVRCARKQVWSISIIIFRVRCCALLCATLETRRGPEIELVRAENRHISPGRRFGKGPKPRNIILIINTCVCVCVINVNVMQLVVLPLAVHYAIGHPALPLLFVRISIQLGPFCTL